MRLGFLTALFLLFLGLKLGGAIAWSWWWVTSPLWGAIVLAIFLTACGFRAPTRTERRR